MLALISYLRAGRARFSRATAFRAPRMPITYKESIKHLLCPFIASDKNMNTISSKQLCMINLNGKKIERQ
jgi:hypothetical protein